MVRVILAEKPSQARDYASALGGFSKHNGYLENSSTGDIITWGFGHLLEIPTPKAYQYDNWKLENLPFFPQIKFEVKEDCKEQYNIVLGLLEKADTVVVGSDPDREGENIAWSILETVPNIEDKTIKRLWSNSIEKNMLLKAFDNLRDASETKNYFFEARARQIADYLIGMNCSPLISLYLQKNGVVSSSNFNSVFSIGRVQTPTLFMVYERELEIRNFKPKTFYYPTLSLNLDNTKLELKTTMKFDDKSELQKKLNFTDNKVFKNTLTELKTELKKEYAPKLFSLSKLQMRMNDMYNMTAKTVLSTVQSLYEKKYLTYPRTGSELITDGEYEYLKKHFNEYCEFLQYDLGVDIESHKPSKKYVDGSKVLEHHAILPTQRTPSKDVFEKFTEDEKRIYNEVIQRTILTFMEPHEYNKTTVVVEIEGIKFTGVGKEVLKPSWKKYLQNTDNEETMLPELSENEQYDMTLVIKEGTTKKPKRLKEKDLLMLMKYATRKLSDEDLESIEEAEENNVEVKKDFDLGTQATTGDIIETLKEKMYMEVKKNMIHLTPKGEILCQAVTGNLLASPAMTAQWEKYLKLIGMGERDYLKFVENIKLFIQKTIETGEEMVKNNINPETIQSIYQMDTYGKCPLCKKGDITYVKKHKFYACSDQECSQTFSKVYCEKEISDTQFKKLLEKGATDKIKNFVSKQGKKFDAAIELELKNNKYTYKFKF